MDYIKTFESFNLRDIFKSKNVRKIDHYLNNVDGAKEDILEPFYELEDNSLNSVDIINPYFDSHTSSDYQKGLKYVRTKEIDSTLSFSISKYIDNRHEGSYFDINDEFKDILFSGISRIEDKFSLKLDEVVVEYKTNSNVSKTRVAEPDFEPRIEEVIVMKNETEWDNKISNELNKSNIEYIKVHFK